MKQGGANLSYNTEEIGTLVVRLANRKLTPYQVEKINLGTVDNKIAEFIQKTVRLDMKEFTHGVDNYALHHTLRKHKYDQIPLVPEDFTKIDIILKNPNTIRYEGKTKQGLHAFKYTKRLNDTIYYYVEEVRTGNRTLHLKTMYKTKTPSGASNALEELGAIRPSHRDPDTVKCF